MHNYDFDTLFLGRPVISLPKCHSTNSYAQELLTNAAPPEGALVVAEEQTAGRGQRGNRWEAAAGQNLTFSLLLRPGFLQVTSQFQLTISISLAIFDLLTELLPNRQVRIKWPNDLYVGEQKIAGILIENLLRGQKLEWSIVGIGLNVNQESFETPQACSLALEAEHSFEKETVLALLLRKLEKRYLALRGGQSQSQRREYLDALYWMGEEHTFADEQGEFRGKIIGVQAAGQLAIYRSGGELSYFENKAVRFVR